MVSGNRWKSWVLTSLPYLTGPKVLEIGHGPGHLQIAMRRKGIFAVGIDASWPMNRVALWNTTHHKLNTLLVYGYAQFMPFTSNSFDQVVATFPAEYIADPHTFTQVHRILKPEGQFILIPGAIIHPNNLYDRFLSWLFRISSLSPDWAEPVKDRLRRSGFDPISLEENLDNSTVLLIIARKAPHD